MEPRRIALDQVVAPRERVLFAALVFFSLVIYGLLGFAAYTNPETGAVILFYGLVFALVGFMAHAFAVGRIRGNGVLVSERQFPLLHQLVTAHARRLGMRNPPTVYVLESGGVLNAFATKVLGRRFVIINADVLASALQRGEGAVSFIVAHELGHHWRGHLAWRWLIGPARLVPYLGSAYSRACEYTCDRIGAHCEPNGAIEGLLLLAAGNGLHMYVNAQEFARQAESDKGYWIRRAELMSTHPRLPKRVAALLALGVASPATQPLAATRPAAVLASA